MQSPRAALARPATVAEDRNPWLVLLVVCTAVFMLLLDTTIVNVAQVEIREGLDADLTQIQWVLDSYILTYAVLLLSFGRLGDVFGRKRLFVLGMAIFTAASALCAASAWIGDVLGISGVNVLIVSRVLPGDRRRLHDAAVALADHGRLPAREARRGDGHLGQRRRPRRGRRPDHRRPHRHQLRLGVGLPDQPAGRHRRRPRDAADRARIDRSAGDQAARLGRACPLRGRHLRLRLRHDRGQHQGLDEPAHPRPLRSSGIVLLVLFVWWERRVARPDDEARTLQDPQLLGRQRDRPDRLLRDARHLLPDDDLPPGRPRLLARSGRPDDDPRCRR